MGRHFMPSSEDSRPSEGWLAPQPALPDFSRRLAVLPQPVLPGRWQHLAASVLELTQTERSYLPVHKKGGTIAYETLRAKAPEVVDLYQSMELRDLVSRLVGQAVRPTPPTDQSSCSVLFYERPGDHIGWHYDHNFYRGRHFTVLLPIENRGHGEGGLSSARLLARLDGREEEIATPPNTLIVFEGARVVHKVTPIAEGERRVILSMTLCADPRIARLKEAARRVKDTAFFGIRALWA